MSQNATGTVAAEQPVGEAIRRHLTDDRVLEALLVLYFPLMIAARWYASDDPSVWVALLEATITAVAWFCAAWTIGWVFWRITGGRSRLGQALFGVSLVALISSSVAMAALQRTRAAAEADIAFREAGVSFLEVLERGVHDREIALEEAEAMRDFARAMERYALRLKGPERGRALAGAAVLREHAPFTEDLARSAKAFVDAGGLSPMTLDSPGAIDARIDLAWAFADAVERLGAVQARRSDRFAEVASLYGVEQGGLGEAQAWFDRVFAGPENEELTTLEGRVADAAVGVLRLLREEWGSWEYDREARRLIFDREATENRYVAMYVALSEAETRKRALQRRLLEENRRRLEPAAPEPTTVADADP